MRLIPLLPLVFICTIANAQLESIRTKINAIAKVKKADVGVSILGLENNDTLTVHGSSHYPMQSFYKFHQALAALHQVDLGKLNLEQPILVKKSDLLPDTHSPLRDDHPGGNFELPLREILRYTVKLSDNNGCDILFRLLGGTSEVNKYIHDIGVKDVAIAATEEEMHKDWNVQFTNWTTPRASTQLAELFYSKNILSKSSFDFLYKTMLETSTGPNRIKGLLPQGTPVAHRTGTSGTNSQGVSSVVDDMAIVTLPNGKHFAIIVMVCNTKEPTTECEEIIAEIALTAYNYFAQ